MLTKVLALSLFLLFISILYFIVFECFYFKKRIPSKDFVDFFRYMVFLNGLAPIISFLVSWESNQFAKINFLCAFLITLSCYLYEKRRFDLFKKLKLKKDIQELIKFFEEK